MKHRNKISLTIIVPAYNNLNNLLDTLKSIDKSKKYFYKKNSSYPNMQVTVVDNSTTKIIKKGIKQLKYSYLSYIKTKPYGLNYARNIGILKAKSFYIILVDSDCIVKKDWIVKIYKSINKNSFPDVIQGAFFKPWKKDFFSISECKWDKIRFYIQKQADGKNIIFKKSAYLKIGGYNIKHFYSSGAESLFLMDRFREKGQTVIFDDQIVVYHKYPALWGELKRYNKFGKASVHIEYKRPVLFKKEFSPCALWKNLLTMRFGKIDFSEYIYQIIKISSFTIGYLSEKKHYKEEIKKGRIISPIVSK